VRLGGAYLVVVALVGAVVALASWASGVTVAWVVPAFALFGAYLRAGYQGGIFREVASRLVGLVVAGLATLVFAFLGLVVAVNIWLTTGRGF
jgi:hypothetical protein